ncbi:MAG: hypothetical protein R3E66_13425 [bacterium]
MRWQPSWSWQRQLPLDRNRRDYDQLEIDSLAFFAYGELLTIIEQVAIPQLTGVRNLTGWRTGVLAEPAASLRLGVRPLIQSIANQACVGAVNSVSLLR